MPKMYWHTKTLFLQNWKYYKWSYSFDHCIICGTCNFKHKWRWLCTSCWDKERKNKRNRKISRKIASAKYSFRRRVNHWLNKITKPKYWPVRILSEEDKKEYKKSWYEKNKEVMKLISKAYRMEKQWLNPLKIMVNWKTRLLPFTTLEKPKMTTDPKYEEWKKNQNDFLKIKSYYFRNNK